MLSGSAMRKPEPADGGRPDESTVISRHATELAAQLRAMSEALFPPASAKELRRFTSGEAARWIGVSDSRLRQLALAARVRNP